MLGMNGLSGHAESGTAIRNREEADHYDQTDHFFLRRSGRFHVATCYHVAYPIPIVTGYIGQSYEAQTLNLTSPFFIRGLITTVI